MTVSIVCGAARGSVGEAICDHLLSSDRDRRLLRVDIAANPRLDSARSAFISHDFRRSRSPDSASLVSQCKEWVAELTHESQGPFIDSVYYCSGVYHSSPIAMWGDNDPNDVICVNLTGFLDVLRCVAVLRQCGDVMGGPAPRVCYVGSDHALRCTANRAVYVAAKIGAVGALIALAKEGAISAATWVAVGPIDTPMLHCNHWVIKSGGDRRFFDFALQSSDRDYDKVFTECDPDAIRTMAEIGRFDVGEMMETLERYRRARKTSVSADDRLLGPREVASHLCGYVPQHRYGDLVRLESSDPVRACSSPLADWRFCD